MHGLFDVSDAEREKRLLYLLEKLEDRTPGTKRRVLATVVLLAGDAAVADIAVEAAKVLRRTTEGG
jgi:hypothetical protein